MQKKRQTVSKINWRPGMAVISKSDAKDKKWKMEFYNDKDVKLKTVHFGHSDYEDYTQHKDEERQKAYLKRHAKDPTEYDTAGELSRVILWSAPTMTQGIINYERKHKMKVVHGL